jgi:hypothetical protein
MHRWPRALVAALVAISGFASVAGPLRAARADDVPLQTPVTLDSPVICVDPFDPSYSALPSLPVPALSDGDASTFFTAWPTTTMECGIERPASLSVTSFTITPYTAPFGPNNDICESLGRVVVNGVRDIFANDNVGEQLFDDYPNNAGPGPYTQLLPANANNWDWIEFIIQGQAKPVNICNSPAVAELTLSGTVTSTTVQTTGDTEEGALPCQQIALSKIQYILPDGSLSSVAQSDAGRLYTYANGSTEATFPASFDPLTASPALLDFYGLPPRPTDSAGLAAWSADWGNVSGQLPDEPGYCTNGRQNTTYSYKENWAGWENVAATDNHYSDTIGQFITPTYVAACPHRSAQSIWTGLGGDLRYSVHILQAGIDSGAQLTDNAAFWDAQSDTEYLTEQDWENYRALPGDKITARVFYNATRGAATMIVKIDYTDGTTYTHTTTPMSTIGDLPASYFYNGRTAEYVNERPIAKSGEPYTVDSNHYTLLRKPEGTVVNWVKGVTNDGAVASGSGLNLVVMQRPNQGNILETGNPIRLSGSWTTQWERCS